MTITSNHWRAGIAAAGEMKPDIWKILGKVECIVVFCNKRECMQLASEDNEVGDVHISQNWWDTVKFFRRQYEMWLQLPSEERTKEKKTAWRAQVIEDYGKPGHDIGTYR